jgi:hypothetical protein
VVSGLLRITEDVIGACPGDHPKVMKGMSFSSARRNALDFTIAIQEVQIVLALSRVLGGNISLVAHVRKILANTWKLGLKKMWSIPSVSTTLCMFCDAQFDTKPFSGVNARTFRLHDSLIKNRCNRFEGSNYSQATKGVECLGGNGGSRDRIIMS